MYIGHMILLTININLLFFQNENSNVRSYISFPYLKIKIKNN